MRVGHMSCRYRTSLLDHPITLSAQRPQFGRAAHVVSRVGTCSRAIAADASFEMSTFSTTQKCSRSVVEVYGVFYSWVRPYRREAMASHLRVMLVGDSHDVS